MTTPVNDDPRWREITQRNVAIDSVDGATPKSVTQVWELSDGDTLWRATATDVNPRARTANPPEGVSIEQVTPDQPAASQEPAPGSDA